jgi:hypothetical protein
MRSFKKNCPIRMIKRKGFADFGAEQRGNKAKDIKKEGRV